MINFYGRNYHVWLPSIHFKPIGLNIFDSWQHDKGLDKPKKAIWAICVSECPFWQVWYILQRIFAWYMVVLFLFYISCIFIFLVPLLNLNPWRYVPNVLLMQRAYGCSWGIFYGRNYLLLLGIPQSDSDPNEMCFFLWIVVNKYILPFRLSFSWVWYHADAT